MTQPERSEASSDVQALATALAEIAQLLPVGWRCEVEATGQLTLTPPWTEEELHVLHSRHSPRV